MTYYHFISGYNYISMPQSLCWFSFPLLSKYVIIYWLSRLSKQHDAFVYYVTTDQSWWRHQMEKIFRVTGLFWGESHRRPVDSPNKSQWRRALIFSLICAWTNGCANNRDACDLKRHCDHYNVTVMCQCGVFNPHCAGTALFRYNTVNIVVAGALTPCVGRTSVAMALIM